MSAGRLPVMSRPLNAMRPAVGARKCVRRLKQVVLPAPLGPMSAWMVPRRTRRFTSRTATKPRNSFVSPCVSRMRSAGTSGRARVKHGLALVLPGAIGLAGLPRGHAVELGGHHLLDVGARVPVERLVEEALDVGVRRRRLVPQPIEHR